MKKTEEEEEEAESPQTRDGGSKGMTGSLMRKMSEMKHRSQETDENDPSVLSKVVLRWIPGDTESIDDAASASSSNSNGGVIQKSMRSLRPRLVRREGIKRSLKRRIFLFLTVPESSVGSLFFFWVVLTGILLMNSVMVCESMDFMQFTPTDCITCGGPTKYSFDTADPIAVPDGIECICPPAPQHWTGEVLKWLVYFFSVEWVMRVATFAPPANECATTWWGGFKKWCSFLTGTNQVLDFLATFPYYLEAYASLGLMPLRLLRLFRVFRLVRLGQYNASFEALISVLHKASTYLKFLVTVLCFGSVFFGSMIYNLERGDWKYLESSESFAFVRQGEDAPSPFYSVPYAFWWYVVTACTVGYGDSYPITTGGQWVAVVAMLTGILAVAFPVSIFTELWSTELRSRRAADEMNAIQEADAEDDCSRKSMKASKKKRPTLSRGPREQNLHDIPDNISDDISDSYAIDEIPIIDEDEAIVISKEDWIEMVTEYATIQESQRRMRALLKKYSPPSEELFRSSANPC